MLQIKNLVKIYKPKKGVPVTALNGVSLKLPESGMVFLLGKSGSGKSTLLNLLGGLDRYDDGEIIIKGISSKSFKQKHFDSYRNTYVGFIFQEYNLLNDFSVGANVALAIELQNRKATDSEVNKILKQVDLEDFGNRKPNELSGGQKQRVAIARALVKNPQIIMADEPSGALDSNTGRQIFDTLKKLSKEKLVIVVSHDREFAELYADRIIELSDGRVISDLECVDNETDTFEETLGFEGNVINVPYGYVITEEDRLRINDYIKNLESSASISLSGKSSAFFKRFVPTNEKRISYLDSSVFKLIKSKLPLKKAFKIGCSNLKYKKFRLVVTIFLSVISFCLFGLSDTFGSYNHIEVCTNSLLDSNVNYLTLSKEKKITEVNYSYWNDYGYYISNENIEDIEKQVGVKTKGVYIPFDKSMDFEGNIPQTQELLDEEYYNICSRSFNGFMEINRELLDSLEYKIIAGRLPDGNKNEIAISKYIYTTFEKVGYINNSGNSSPEKISNYDDIISKKVTLADDEYTITAVIDTGFDAQRYKLLGKKLSEKNESEVLQYYVLLRELQSAVSYSYHGLAMTGDGFVERMVANSPKKIPITEGYLSFNSDNASINPNYLAKLSDVKNKIVWLDGEKSELQEKEIIVSSDIINYWSDKEDYENVNIDKYCEILRGIEGFKIYKDKNTSEKEISEDGYKVVGIIDTKNQNQGFSATVVCSPKLISEFTEKGDNYYSFALGIMPQEKDDIKRAVEFSYDESSNVRYAMNNPVTFELNIVNEILQELSKVFLWIGVLFAVFSSVMLANFIAISITNKKQEIGILRAIGSRSNDVFRIFFAESFTIAMINFVLASVAVGVITACINLYLRQDIGILITILSFGARQILLLFFISVFVAFVASFLPVKRIASKRPIDAINNK